MASKELTQALNDLTNAVNTAIPLLKPNNDADTIAAIAPLTAALVSAIAGSVPSGGAQFFRVVSVPANLSTFQLNGSSVFQFFLPGNFAGNGIGVAIKADTTPSDVIDSLIAADNRIKRLSSDSFSWSNPGFFSGTQTGIVEI